MGEKQCETSSRQALAFENIKVEYEGAVAYLFIDRPRKMNTLSVDTLRELVLFFKSLLYDRRIRVVVVESAGDKVFVAGADIKELDSFDKYDALWFCDLGHELFNTMERVPQVIIAAIDGYCMGGGFDFSMACDLRIASDRAKIAHTACKMGIITGFGGTQRLRRLVGVRAAKEMFFTARILSASEALELGIVHEVVEHDRLGERVRELAKNVALRSWGRLSAIKSLLNRAYDMDAKGFGQYQIYTILARC